MTQFEVRCPNCGALQFLSRMVWHAVAIDEATLAIKCWRRTCKRVQGWRVMKGERLSTAGVDEIDRMDEHGRNGQVRTVAGLEVRK